MQLNHSMQHMYDILKSELISSTGCTEPVSIALAAAKAKEVLGYTPEDIQAIVSDGIVKNAKSVVIPQTDNLKGIEIAIAAGIVVGHSVKNLNLLADLAPAEKEKICAYHQQTNISVNSIRSAYLFDVTIIVKHGHDSAKVRLLNHHTNFVLIEKNGAVLFSKDYAHENDQQAKLNLSVQRIFNFAQTVDIEQIKPLLDVQISQNTAIAKEGISGDYGAGIGKLLIEDRCTDFKNLAKAHAASASDARMSGSNLPVTIVSGSGNQGLTTSLPVITYAKHHNISQEKLYRALVLANLLTIHQKSVIGPLSAFCGAVSAGASSGAAMSYMRFETYEAVAHSIVNTLGMASGMICDGAKPSCAAKVALAVDAGILGYEMVVKDKEFLDGEGIISKGVENTIRNIGRIAKDGMRSTDEEIIKIMTSQK